MTRLYVSDIDIIAGDIEPGSVDNPNRPEPPLTRDELIALAVEELREADFSTREHDILAGVRDRCSGEERDLLDRVLEIVAPRRRP